MSDVKTSEPSLEQAYMYLKFSLTSKTEWPSGMQRQGIRLRQLGWPIARGNHFSVWATKIYFIPAQPGKYKPVVSVQQYHSSYKHQKSCLSPFSIKNHVLISYKPSTYSYFLTLHILFCYSSIFGQAVLWPSLPNRAIKNRENYRSLQGMIQQAGA